MHTPKYCTISGKNLGSLWACEFQGLFSLWRPKFLNFRRNQKFLKFNYIYILSACSEMNKHHFKLTNRIMCILCTPRPIYRSTYRPTLNRCIGRHIDQIGQHINRYLANMSANISTNTRPKCWLRRASRHIARHISRVPVDRWLDIEQVLFCVFMDQDGVEVHKRTKKEWGEHPAILTEKAWSKKNLLFGFREIFLTGHGW